MPIVNYVREHIRFMEYATDEHLTSSERLLWYALMHIMNQRAQGKVWPDEFIRVSNDRLLSYCPMKYDTIAAARNSLKQRGLIEFTKGEKNKLSPAYRMIYFFPEYVAPESDADNPQGYPKNSGNIRYNMGGNIGYNMEGNIGGNLGGNSGYFNINYNGNSIPDVFQTDLDEDEKQYQQAYARARAEADAAWKSEFGKVATPTMLHELAWRDARLGFEEGILSKAIRLAAMKGTNSPLEYIFAVLADWKSHKVKTVIDAEEYAAIRDAQNGKFGYMSASEAFDAERAFVQDRETETEREQREECEAREEEEREKRRAMIASNEEERKRQEYQRERDRLDSKYKGVAYKSTI